jgi:hypothetical protein
MRHSSADAIRGADVPRRAREVVWFVEAARGISDEMSGSMK